MFVTSHPSGITPSSLSNIFPPLDLYGFPSSFGNSKSTNQRLNKVWASSSRLEMSELLTLIFLSIQYHNLVTFFCSTKEGNFIFNSFKSFVVKLPLEL